MASVRNEQKYVAIRYLHETNNYSIEKMCKKVHINRSAYYKWLKHTPSKHQLENEELVEWIKETYEEHDGVLGYRQMTITINREHNTKFNHKRFYRLMGTIGLKSVCRKRKHNYIKSTPEITAENILNRDFYSDKINEKWLTDVTEFKYGNGQKAYLSAILDLADRRIVSYVVGHSNNNQLVFDTFDKALELNSNAKPIFHSDRGFQYTTKSFRHKLDVSGMTQSMSRVGRCIDNGPMEGFWGILKSEMYYLHKFYDYDSLKSAIENYISYYNTKRYQKRLKCMAPLEFHAFFHTESCTN